MLKDLVSLFGRGKVRYTNDANQGVELGVETAGQAQPVAGRVGLGLDELAFNRAQLFFERFGRLANRAVGLAEQLAPICRLFFNLEFRVRLN